MLAPQAKWALYSPRVTERAHSWVAPGGSSPYKVGLRKVPPTPRRAWSKAWLHPLQERSPVIGHDAS